jgi:hypothetical protein
MLLREWSANLDDLPDEEVDEGGEEWIGQGS